MPIALDGHAADLRTHVQQRLPDHMVPAAYVLLETLPLTPNGKLDRNALPALSTPEDSTGFAIPQTPAERLLAEIWSDVLRLDRVGVHDNFFALGGDSILSIQIVARAAQGGLRISPRDLFQHQTIAALAALAERQAGREAALAERQAGREAALAEQGVLTGPVPLTPIQRWFFEQDLPEPHHWNQALLLETRTCLDAALLEQAVAHLLQHHDALRLRFHRTVDGWRQEYAAAEDTPIVSYLALPSDESAALTAAASALQASLNLATGPLLRVALFNVGPDAPGRLLLILHHLVTDGVSWRILLEDLLTAYRQLEAGHEPALPPKTSSVRQWAERLTTFALYDERAYWLAALPSDPPRLPLDFPGGDNSAASEETVTLFLSPDETHQLLHEVPQAYHTRTDEVLLTALAQSFAAWTGHVHLLVDIESHGRTDLFPDLDLSRTVGWLTALYPVALTVDPAADEAAALKSVKEQLRAIPNGGVGYGILRHLTGDDALRALPRAEVSFNYLGQFDQLAPGAPFRPAHEDIGPTASPLGRRPYVLTIGGAVSGGQLRLDWSYSTGLHRRATIEALAADFLQALRGLIAHCAAPDSVGYTPSDFPEAGLTQEEIDALVAEFQDDPGGPPQ